MGKGRNQPENGSDSLFIPCFSGFRPSQERLKAAAASAENPRNQAMFYRS